MLMTNGSSTKKTKCLFYLFIPTLEDKAKTSLSGRKEEEVKSSEGKGCFLEAVQFLESAIFRAISQKFGKTRTVLKT